MRVLTANEIAWVAGAGDDCSSGGSGNDLGGISNSETVGQDLVNIYEGVVSAVSHVIERIAEAL